MVLKKRDPKVVLGSRHKRKSQEQIRNTFSSPLFCSQFQTPDFNFISYCLLEILLRSIIPHPKTAKWAAQTQIHMLRAPTSNYLGAWSTSKPPNKTTVVQAFNVTGQSIPIHPPIIILYTNKSLQQNNFKNKIK